MISNGVAMGKGFIILASHDKEEKGISVMPREDKEECCQRKQEL